MMLKNDIANMALGHLGVSSVISDFQTDNSTEGKILRRYFRRSLDDLLEQHDWTFAKRTAKLFLQSEDPEYGYKYSYIYPVNAIVVREVAPNGMFLPDIELYEDQILHFEERVFGNMRLIYTNVSDAYAKYTEKIEENSTFPSSFGRALAAQLALDMGPQLITSNWPKVANAINSLAFNTISKGIADDIAKSPQKKFAESPLVRVRYK